MQTHIRNKSLTIGSVGALAVASALLATVLERLAAATWQWYKFVGFSNDGHINLSLGSGLLLSGLSAVTFVFALHLNRVAKRRNARRATTASLSAIYIAAIATLAYWLLGMSSLNVWLP